MKTQKKEIERLTSIKKEKSADLNINKTPAAPLRPVTNNVTFLKGLNYPPSATRTNSSNFF